MVAPAAPVIFSSQPAGKFPGMRASDGPHITQPNAWHAVTCGDSFLRSATQESTIVGDSSERKAAPEGRHAAAKAWDAQTLGKGLTIVSHTVYAGHGIGCYCQVCAIEDTSRARMYSLCVCFRQECVLLLAEPAYFLWRLIATFPTRCFAEILPGTSAEMSGTNRHCLQAAFLKHRFSSNDLLA